MKALISILCVALVTGCASTLQARSDADASQDFSRYHTYAWIEANPMVTAPGVTLHASPLNQRRIVEAIEKELGGKGFQKIDDPAGADFVVSYTVGARDRIDIQSYPVPYRGPWAWGWSHYGHDVDVNTYREGTLSIDIFDGARHQPVWHGWATKRITDRDVRNAAEQIPVAVAAILAEFPPRAG